MKPIIKTLSLLALLAAAFQAGRLQGWSSSPVKTVDFQASMAEMVKSQPNTAFKANLLTVMAYHASNSDLEMMNTLMPMALRKRNQLVERGGL